MTDVAQHENAYFNGCVILKEPKCLFLGVNGSAECPISIFGIDAYLEQEQSPVVAFINPMWSLQSEWFRTRILDSVTRQHERYPRHKIVMLVNDQEEYKFLGELPRSIYKFVCGEICATDVNLFKSPGLEVQPGFDSVYIARPEAYKRIELARNIEKLAVIARGLNERNYPKLKEWVPNAYCPNYRETGFVELRGHEVAEFLPQACSGLILSAVEGQNRATSEYILSGLPVITTPSVGGRHRLLHPGNSIVVEPSAEAVRSAVEYVKRSNFDRKIIHEEGVRAIKSEKMWFRNIVETVLHDSGLPELGDRELAIPHHGSSAAKPYRDFV